MEGQGGFSPQEPVKELHALFERKKSQLHVVEPFRDSELLLFAAQMRRRRKVV